ncbi:MAG: hypothetical protein IKF60_01465, partial [Solobacterium sp.]|nr:hypothetical protein [Solobacterium sp.]
MLQRTYELDMVPGGIPLSIHLSQYDSDVTLIFQLYASQGILAIPNEGVTATIRGTKLDGNGISAEAVFSFVDSIPTVTVQVTKQMTAIAGKNTFELLLKATSGSSEYDLPSANFYLDVERAALDYDTLASKSEIMEIQEILADADSVIEALEVSKTTQSNMAALTQRAETAATNAERDAETASDAKDDAVSAKDTAVAAVNGFNNTVNTATASAVSTVQAEGTAQVARITAAGDDIEEYAQGVIEDAEDAIDAVKDTAVAAVQSAQTTAVAAVNSTKDSAMTTINAKAAEIDDVKSAADQMAATALQQSTQAINEVAGVEETVDSVRSTVSALDLVLAGKVDGGYVENDSLYLTSDGEVVAGPFTGFGGGGGGGGSATNNAVLTLTNTSGFVSKTIASGSPLSLSINWSSIEDNMPTGNGSLTVKVGGIVKAILDVAQGNVSVSVGDYLSTGSNAVQLMISDSYGNNRVKNYTISVIELYVTSSFDDSAVQTGVLAFPYTPYGAVSKTVHFVLDGVEQETVTTSVSGRQQTYVIPVQTHGAHSLRVYFEATVNGNTVRSNELYCEIVWARVLNETPVIASSYNELTVMQFATVNIPFMVYTPGVQVSDVSVSVNGTVVSTITVDRTRQIFSYQLNNSGTQTIVFRTGSVTKTITLTVTPANIDVAAETEDLALYLSSRARSNNEADPAVWTFGEGASQIAASFSGFNWVSDGWLRDEDGITVLRVMGSARVTIPFQPFASDFRASGKTIEIEFATRQVLDYDSVILSCISGGRGLVMTPQKATLTSEQSEIAMQYKEDEHVRITFVCEKRSENRLLLVYINGIPSGVVQYPADDDFSQAVATPITIGSSDCGIDIYCIRIYDNDLNRKQVMDNWIADTQDGALMLRRYSHNDVYDAYGNIVIAKLPSDLPYMVLEAAQLPQYKGDKKTITGSYTDPVNPSKSFSFSGCQINVQGTSSAPYARKNYDLQFKSGFEMTASGNHADTFALDTSVIPFNRFVLKADVASSEGANNVELVKLFCEIAPFQTREKQADPRIRQGIFGFPIVVFWYNTESGITSFLGKYNFNLPKRAPEPYGYSGDMESWEFQNNMKIGFTGSRKCRVTNYVCDLWKLKDEPEYNYSSVFECVSPANLKKGDWLFWDQGSSCPCGHVGMLWENYGNGYGLVLGQNQGATYVNTKKELLDVMGGLRWKGWQAIVIPYGASDVIINGHKYYLYRQNPGTEKVAVVAKALNEVSPIRELDIDKLVYAKVGGANFFQMREGQYDPVGTTYGDISSPLTGVYQNLPNQDSTLLYDLTDGYFGDCTFHEVDRTHDVYSPVLVFPNQNGNFEYARMVGMGHISNRNRYSFVIRFSDGYCLGLAEEELT